MDTNNIDTNQQVSHTNIKKAQLEIRNTHDGMIWQIYHVQDRAEAIILASNAAKNGFCSAIINPEITDTETWPNWREGNQYIIDAHAAYLTLNPTIKLEFSPYEERIYQRVIE